MFMSNSVSHFLMIRKWPYNYFTLTVDRPSSSSGATGTISNILLLCAFNNMKTVGESFKVQFMNGTWQGSKNKHTNSLLLYSTTMLELCKRKVLLWPISNSFGATSTVALHRQPIALSIKRREECYSGDRTIEQVAAFLWYSDFNDHSFIHRPPIMMIMTCPKIV